MTKTELLSTYTPEQLVEMVVEMENVSKLRITKCEVSEDKKLIKGKCDKCGEEFILSLDNKYILCTKAELYATQEANRQLNKDVSELQSEVEKYRKAFKGAKKECDCRICEYQKKIEELKRDLEYKDGTKMFETLMENTRGEARECLARNMYENLRCVFRYEKTADEVNVANYLPTEPIKVAEMLINAEGEYEHNSLAKAFCGTDKGTYRIFDISDLRQIAEHLLVYCNHNGGAEE